MSGSSSSSSKVASPNTIKAHRTPKAVSWPAAEVGRSKLVALMGVSASICRDSARVRAHACFSQLSCSSFYTDGLLCSSTNFCTLREFALSCACATRSVESAWLIGRAASSSKTARAPSSSSKLRPGAISVGSMPLLSAIGFPNFAKASAIVGVHYLTPAFLARCGVSEGLAGLHVGRSPHRCLSNDP